MKTQTVSGFPDAPARPSSVLNKLPGYWAKHPGLGGWMVMDSELDCPLVEARAADSHMTAVFRAVHRQWVETGTNTPDFEAFLLLGKWVVQANQIAPGHLLLVWAHSDSLPAGMLSVLMAGCIRQLTGVAAPDGAPANTAEAPGPVQATERRLPEHQAVSKGGVDNDALLAAVRTQQEFLGDVRLLQKHLPEHFLLYRPKSQVSGDFYWFRYYPDCLVIALADCTGHSVEGALMTVLGASLLRVLVNSGNCRSPQLILNEIQLHMLENGVEDRLATLGMEMGICTLDFKARKIYYAGAMMDLHHIAADKLQLHKAKRVPLSASHNKPAGYEKHEIPMQTGDAFYMFSDGLSDQFGDHTARKLGKKQVVELLEKSAGLPLIHQQNVVLKHLNDWQGQTEQTDDITLLAFRVP